MNAKKARIGVFGASGKMGCAVVDLVAAEYNDQATIGAKISRSRGQVSDFLYTDAIVDFSLPDGTSTLLTWLISRTERLPVYLCGTTGLLPKHYAQLDELSDVTPVMHATNFSNGVAALAAILQFATPLLAKLSYQPSITETHHMHKLDLPSGTAKTISEVVKNSGGAVANIHSIREGEIIGKHDVVFSGAVDEIVIGHAASSRDLFARGVIEAALWLCGQDQSTGIFTMDSYFRTRFGL